MCFNFTKRFQCHLHLPYALLLYLLSLNGIGVFLVFFHCLVLYIAFLATFLLKKWSNKPQKSCVCWTMYVSDDSYWSAVPSHTHTNLGGENRCEWNYIRKKLNKLMSIENLPNKLFFCTMRTIGTSDQYITEKQ